MLAGPSEKDLRVDHHRSAAVPAAFRLALAARVFIVSSSFSDLSSIIDIDPVSVCLAISIQAREAWPGRSAGCCCFDQNCCRSATAGAGLLKNTVLDVKFSTQKAGLNRSASAVQPDERFH